MFIQKKQNPVLEVAQQGAIRHEWLNFPALFLIYKSSGISTNYMTEMEFFRNLCKKQLGDKTPSKEGKSLIDAVLAYVEDRSHDEWDNVEAFVDRESIEERIDELSVKASEGDTIADILRAVLTPFRDKLQSRKNFQ